MVNMRQNSSKAVPQLPPGYKADPNRGPMLRYQESLPHLPVPTLSSTLSKYLETVQPHLTPAEYAKTETTVHAFETSPIARELQRRLEARAADPSIKNWLADWWNETAYMGYRDPVVVYVSYFYLHLENGTMSAAQRAATLIKAMLPFRLLVETKIFYSELLEPEVVRGVPLCMASYKWLFHASRYPTVPSDTAHKFDSRTHNHVVFIRNNRFFEVALAHPDGRELSAADLEQQIAQVIKLADSGIGPAVGALTSDNRDNWAHARQRLLEASPNNKDALERLESAMVIVPLDPTKPTSREDLSWSLWVGNGRNRWYDKHQLIVFDNGRSGFLGEHSCMDGTPTLRMNEFILAALAAGKVELGHPFPSLSLPTPTEITFELSSQNYADIASAEAAFDKLVAAHDLEVLHFGAYGKEYIKKFKASPDAWVQLVKQLAFWKFKGRPAVTYESTQTRKFQLGRTEVTRSASNESKAWVAAMVDPTASDETRCTLFRSAVARHVQYAAEAADGQGVDRHLFGLKNMLRKGEEVPEIYKDPAYGRTNHWELSTSQLSSRFIDGWGYGEVVPDGYGMSYSIGDDYIRWTITSLKLDTARLKQCLLEAAEETSAMMDHVAAATSKSKL
ncbi:acyltransferase ChoActase/COT/CPT [Vararia minispora EC-137]|uniref:Acyltransferase ChoActase/COT/CPT n=1 Tax=Vararia minispora EC-137 TaxID=1314806 RepID=A0ACB8QC72_9AGAM|nr:acyltransferase ChoActase/COT/CPT [Vararia minispora EC-137]